MCVYEGTLRPVQLAELEDLLLKRLADTEGSLLENTARAPPPRVHRSRETGGWGGGIPGCLRVAYQRFAALSPQSNQDDLWEGTHF